jgi:ankyrin repeat protein
MTTLIILMQAAERGQYDVAALLVAARRDLANARDKRGLSAIDLVKIPDDRWSVLLTS